MKKTIALILILLVALGLTACAGGAQSKSPYEITVYADEALEAALTDIAKAYTDKEVNTNANEEFNILFRFDSSDKLAGYVTDGAYSDVFISLGAEPMDAIAASLVADSRANLVTDASATYTSALLTAGTNQDAAQAFLDYLHSSKAKEIFEGYGFTIAN